MKKLLGMMLYAVLMFGVTAGLGMFMLKKAATHGTDESHDAGAEHKDTSYADPANGHSGDSQATSDSASSAAPSRHSDQGATHVGDSHAAASDSPSAETNYQDDQLPVAVRASPMSVEEIVRMGLSLKSRDEIVHKREESLRETEAQQRLVLSDIASAQQEIENLLAQAHDQRAAAEELLSRLAKQNEAAEAERQSLVAEKQQIQTDRDAFVAAKREIETERTQLAVDQQQLQADRKRLNQERDQLVADQEKLSKARQDATAPLPEVAPAVTAKADPVLDEASRKQNLKELTEMFEGMSAETAAKSIKVLSTNGETDMIVDVLTSLDQRKASAILDAISDEQLVSEFLMKINSRNNSQKSAARN